MSTEFERQCTKVVIDAIAKVRKQKQRPSLERVSAALLVVISQPQRTQAGSQGSPSDPADQTVNASFNQLPRASSVTLSDAVKWIELAVGYGAVVREEINGIISFRPRTGAVAKMDHGSKFKRHEHRSKSVDKSGNNETGGYCGISADRLTDSTTSAIVEKSKVQSNLDVNSGNLTKVC